jgi:hypothetical protein
VAIAFGETVRLKSPDENYTLQMTVVHPDWTNQRVTVSVWPFLTRQSRPVETDTAYRLPLGWFDFPFTDNTLLPDGNRFAIYLRLVSAKFERLTVVAMWFPKGYFTPRERPCSLKNGLYAKSAIGADQSHSSEPRDDGRSARFSGGESRFFNLILGIGKARRRWLRW